MNSTEHSETTMATESTSVCLHCGASLSTDDRFCTKCGTPRGEEKTEPCAQCGEKLHYGQKFCPKCGEKKEWAIGAKMDHGIRKSKSAFHKAWKYVGAGLAAILVIVLAVVLIPNLTMSVDELCAEGKYARAYRKADKEQRDEILAENSAAVLCADILENSQTDGDDSFKLNSVEYMFQKTDNGSLELYIVLVLEIEKNIYGNIYGTKEMRWFYEWDLEHDEWKDITSDDRGWAIAAQVHNEGEKLSNKAIKRIQGLFESGRLEDVKMLNFH